MSDPIYRLPPIKYGPKVYIASELGDIVDWGLRMQGVPENWVSQGEGVLVGVLDTGKPNHVDLGDAVVAARNFSNSPTVDDKQGHSSHCSGIIAARKNNQGVVGVAPKAGLCIAKVLGDDGSGTSPGIAAGIRWCVSQGCDILSMSLGGAYDADIERAVNEAVAAGVFVICAAGNEGAHGENTVGYPGALSNVVTVAAYNKQGLISNFSSRGKQIELAAPGEDILSTVLSNQYQRMSGTCIAEGSYVYTVTGPKKIEHVQAGDVVFAFDKGKLVERPVHGCFARGRAETHRLVAHGRDVKATASHEMLTVNVKAKEIEWVRLGELKEHHRLILPREMKTQINPYLDRLLDKDFCYLLGFFAGDGWITSGTRGIRTCFAAGDKPAVSAEIKRIYEKIVSKQLKSNKSGTWLFDDCTSLAMIIDVLGMNNPASSKNFPLWLWNLAEDKQQAFYQGYLRADAHSRKRPQATARHLECVSPDLVRRTAIFADYHGWTHGYTNSRTRKTKAPNQTHDNWTTTYLLNLQETRPNGGWGALNCGNKKGQEYAEQLARDMGIDIDQYFSSNWHVLEKESSTENVYDLNVPNADCFVTQGIVTHNSMATPFVAGLTAELIGRQRMAEKNGQKIENKLTNNQQLIARIAQFADDKGPAGRDTAWGYGVVDIKKFLEVKGTATPPVTPTPSPTPIPSTDTPLLGGLIMVRENVTIDGKTGFFVYMP